MINLGNIEEVKLLQTHLRTVFDCAPGKEAMSYLEQLCGWYDFQDVDQNVILIKHGKRQVLASIKTLLNLTAEQVVQLSTQKELEDG